MTEQIRDHADAAAVSNYTLEQQSRLTLLLDDYLTQLENGERPDETALIAANPEIATILRAQLDNLRLLHQAADTPAGSGMSHYTAPKHLGDYELQREIGRGGMGIVYEAIDRTLHRQVALKVLPFAAVLDRKQIARFRNEAQAAAQLSHPNIVPVYSVGVDRGVHFYAMQFVEGRPLSDAILDLHQRKEDHQTQAAADDAKTDVWPHASRLFRRNPVLDETAVNDSVGEVSSHQSQHATCQEDIHVSGDGSGVVNDHRDEPQRSLASTARRVAISTYAYPVGADFFQHAARLGIQVAEGLQHAHDFGVVHRDVKPSNLLLDDTGKIWIADFGLAHIPNDVSMTAPGDVLGTVRYMSPEQASGRGAFVDHRTDIYSLGLTLYELVTFQPAFSSNRRQRLLEQLATDPTAPRKINPAIPVDLETIINKAMSTEPSERYASAQAMADDLRRFVEGRPTLARRPALVDRIAKWSWRHRRAVTAAFLGLALATCGSAVATIKLSAERNRTAAALDESQTNYQAARAIVDRLGVRVSEELAWIPGTEKIRRELLTETQNYYDFFLTQSADEIVRRDSTLAMTKAANIAGQLGQKEQALALYAEAREHLNAMIAESPDELEFPREYARCLNNEGVLLKRLGRTDEALARLDEALRRHESLAQRFGAERLIDDLASAQANRAVVLGQRNEIAASRQAYQEAIPSLRQALKLASDDFERAKRLSVCLNNLASTMGKTDPDQALQHCLEAIEIQQRLTRQHPGIIPLSNDLAISYHTLAMLRESQDEWDQALPGYQQAIQIQEHLSELAPGNLGYRTDLAVSLNSLGQLHVRMRHYESALSAFRHAEEILQTLVKMTPDNVTYVSDLGAVQFNQGMALVALEREEEAKKICRQGLDLQKLAVDQAPREPRFQEILVTQTREFERIFNEVSRN